MEKKLSYEEFLKNYLHFCADSFVNNETIAKIHGYVVERCCTSWLFFDPKKLITVKESRDEACEFANRYMYQNYLSNMNW